MGSVSADVTFLSRLVLVVLPPRDKREARLKLHKLLMMKIVEFVVMGCNVFFFIRCPVLLFKKNKPQID